MDMSKEIKEAAARLDSNTAARAMVRALEIRKMRDQFLQDIDTEKGANAGTIARMALHVSNIVTMMVILWSRVDDGIQGKLPPLTRDEIQHKCEQLSTMMQEMCIEAAMRLGVEADDYNAIASAAHKMAEAILDSAKDVVEPDSPDGSGS